LHDDAPGWEPDFVQDADQAGELYALQGGEEGHRPKKRLAGQDAFVTVHRISVFQMTRRRGDVPLTC
jgi:hypothetical protein